MTTHIPHVTPGSTLAVQTFDDVWEQQENNHQMNVVQLTLTWHHESAAPPPFSLLALMRNLAEQGTKATGHAIRYAARRGSDDVRRISQSFAPLFDEGARDDVAPASSESWELEDDLLAVFGVSLALLASRLVTLSRLHPVSAIFHRLLAVRVSSVLLGNEIISSRALM